MEPLIIISIFIIGTIFGSLGSVLLTRLDENTNRQTIKGILFGFSCCPYCKKRLHANNLIPIISYFKQQGKCTFCKHPISAIYPILEITSGLIFVMTYILVYHMLAYMVPDPFKMQTLLFRAITNRSLLLLIIYDIQHYELHMPTRILSIVWILGRQFTGLIGTYKRALLGSLLFGGVFWGIYMFGKQYVKRRYHKNQEGFGEGDIYVGLLLGSLAPFVAMYNLLEPNIRNNIKILITVLILASLIGLVYFYIRKGGENIGLSQKTTKQYIQGGSIPFIPALIIAFRILLFKADTIIPLLFK